MNYGELTEGMFNPPQTQPGFGRPEMVKNNAGGYGFQVGNWERLRRFLILGTYDTYYVSSTNLAVENAKVILDCIKENGIAVVDECVRVSDQGLAPKNDPAIFVMALCASFGDDHTRIYAFSKLNKVCRIGTHLMTFVGNCKNIRGWGRGMRNAIASWYNDMPADKLAYQVIKYQNRKGWSHRDLLRKAHPQTTNAERNAIYEYITQGKIPNNAFIQAFEDAKTANKGQVIKLITDIGLTWEMIPNEFLNDPEIWDALLPKMPLTALMRNLNKMTAVGLIKPNAEATKIAAAKLTDTNVLEKSRLHPLNILIAYKTYSEGHGNKGNLQWIPVAQIKTALDEAYLKAFKYQEPTGKRISLAFDISGSMWGTRCMGLDNFTAAEASGALGLCLTSTEESVETYAFTTNYIPLAFPKTTNIEGALAAVNRNLRYGATDCALPMLHAAQNNIAFDAFVIFTDNETWYGDVHPYEALKKYRQKMGIDAKLIVCAMTASYHTIADPKDNGMLDTVGFDSSLPSIISNFMAGNI